MMAIPFLPPIAALLRPRLAPHTLHRTLRHALHSSAVLQDKPLPPRRVIPESEIIENFLKGSGPGGQKINKTSSAVQLKHIPTGIVVKYQDTRSRAQNRKTARKLLQDRLEELELGDEARTRIKAREKSKKKASSDKKKRRKYRALEAGKEGEEGGEDGGEGVVEGGDVGKSIETQGQREDVGKIG
jgi:protein subunit release factor B